MMMSDEHHHLAHLPPLVRISPFQIRRDLARVEGFNARAAVVLTGIVGTMWAFWVFNGIALVSLPAAIQSGNMTILVAWVSSNWIQLILLPALLVGQRLQAAASDVRAEQQFRDVETVMDRLDEHTAGGITSVLDELAEVKALLKR